MKRENNPMLKSNKCIIQEIYSKIELENILSDNNIKTSNSKRRST